MQSVLHVYSMCFSVSCCELFFSPSYGISPLNATNQDILLYAVNTMYMQKDMRIQRSGSFQTAPSNMQ